MDKCTYSTTYTGLLCSARLACSACTRDTKCFVLLFRMPLCRSLGSVRQSSFKHNPYLLAVAVYCPLPVCMTRAHTCTRPLSLIRRTCRPRTRPHCNSHVHTDISAPNDTCAPLLAPSVYLCPCMPLDVAEGVADRGVIAQSTCAGVHADEVQHRVSGSQVVESCEEEGVDAW